MATSPLLRTKLYIPKSRPGLVPRPRLTERLNQGTGGKLTLVSAPAGFGKTTLLAEWLANAEADTGPAAWVALDQNDNEPALFWAYVIAALQTVHAQVGTRTLSLLQSPQPLPVETLLATLVNEINAISGRFVLVLDDYHLIDAPAVHQGIAFLLDHLLAAKPSNLTFEQAAAVPTSASTALQALRNTGEIQPEQKVLIVGASGGVGLFAVQIAKSFGDGVTGVCTTAQVDMVRAIGADHVIDYTTEDFTRSISRIRLLRIETMRSTQ